MNEVKKLNNHPKLHKLACQVYAVSRMIRYKKEK